MSFSIRLKEYIDYKRLNNSSFEVQTSLKNGTIHRVIKKNTSLNGDNIIAIGLKWKDLDMNWLLLGEGEMLKTEASELDANKESNFDVQSNKNNNTDFEAQLDRADRQIKLQNDMIALLKEIIEEQKKAANKTDSTI